MPVRTAALAAICAVLATSLPAFGYVRTMTCRESGPANDPLTCDGDEIPKPLFWDEACVTYHINQTGLPADEDPEDVYEAIRLSADEWTGQDCSDLSLLDGGFTNEDRVGYNSCSSSNANIIVFRSSSWRHARGALALTSVTYDMGTGEIVDADIELNNTGTVRFTTSSLLTQVNIDIRNTVTHEMGHLIGLDHTDDPEATMFATAPRGELKKQDLADDDVEAICDVYPAGAMSNVCDTSQIGFFERPENGPGEACSDGGGGCAVATAGPLGASGEHWAAALLVTGYVLVRHRRRA